MSVFEIIAKEPLLFIIVTISFTLIMTFCCWIIIRYITTIRLDKEEKK